MAVASWSPARLKASFSRNRVYLWKYSANLFRIFSSGRVRRPGLLSFVEKASRCFHRVIKSRPFGRVRSTLFQWRCSVLKRIPLEYGIHLVVPLPKHVLLYQAGVREIYFYCSSGRHYYCKVETETDLCHRARSLKLSAVHGSYPLVNR
jgi:hypothetical protein